MRRGNDDLRIGGAVVSAQCGNAHGTRDSSCVHQDIGMARRRNHLDTETLHVEHRRDGCKDLDLACVASAAVHAIHIYGAFDAFEQCGFRLGDLLVHFALLEFNLQLIRYFNGRHLHQPLSGSSCADHTSFTLRHSGHISITSAAASLPEALFTRRFT